MIKIDLKMPKVCGDCRFIDCNGEYPFCLALRQNRGYNFDIMKRKFPNCPLKDNDDPEKDAVIEKQKDMLRVMFNRCHVTGSADGRMCFFCGLKKECTELTTVK